MNNTDKILDYLIKKGKVLCDDCLSEKLDVKLRQQVNQICNKLKIKGLSERDIKEVDILMKRQLKLLVNTSLIKC